MVSIPPSPISAPPTALLGVLQAAFIAQHAATLLLYRKQNASIGDVMLDASISETHSRSARATRHPVEKGSDISDHVHVEPDEITIEGEVTNTPVVFGGAFAAGFGRAEEAFNTLDKLIKNKTPVSIITTLKRYDNMVLESLKDTRNAELGNTAHFTCTAKSVLTVESLTIAAPATDLNAAKPTQSGGEKPAAAVKTPTSFFKAGINAAKTAFGVH